MLSFLKKKLLPLALIGGGALSLGVASEGCIVPDTIYFPTDGYKWCATLANVRAWTLGDSVDGQNIADDGEWPTACLCMTEAESDALEGWEQNPPQVGDPDYSEYEQLTEAIQNAALEACNEMKDDVLPDLIYDNCATISESATVFRADGDGESDCKYLRSGETDGFDTDGYDTDPSRDISCRGQSCQIEAAFWAGIQDDPLGLHTDKTNGSFGKAGTTLSDVYPGSIAYALGLRSGDLVTAVDGLPVSSIEEVEAAIAALEDQVRWQVTVRRGSRTVVFQYQIV